MGGGISSMAKKELLNTIRDSHRYATKRDKGRKWGEFRAVTVLHREQAIRPLAEVATM